MNKQCVFVWYSSLISSHRFVFFYLDETFKLIDTQTQIKHIRFVHQSHLIILHDWNKDSKSFFFRHLIQRNEMNHFDVLTFFSSLHASIEDPLKSQYLDNSPLHGRTMNKPKRRRKNERYSILSHRLIEQTLITLNKLSWPRPCCSLNKSCSGYVRVMSRRMTLSQGEFIFIKLAYVSFAWFCSTLVKHCQSNGRYWDGTPVRINS